MDEMNLVEMLVLPVTQAEYTKVHSGKYRFVSILYVTGAETSSDRAAKKPIAHDELACLMS